MTTVKCSNEIRQLGLTTIITVINKHYNHSNNWDTFITSNYISVYADHAMNTSSITLLISMMLVCTWRWSQTLCPLAKLWARHTGLASHGLSSSTSSWRKPSRTMTVGWYRPDDITSLSQQCQSTQVLHARVQYSNVSNVHLSVLTVVSR